MRLEMYSIRDCVADEFMPPFYAANDQVAKRDLQAQLYQGQSQLTMFPQDYQLVHVGSFMTTNAVVVPDDGIRIVCTVQSLIPVGGVDDVRKCSTEDLSDRGVS